MGVGTFGRTNMTPGMLVTMFRVTTVTASNSSTFFEFAEEEKRSYALDSDVEGEEQSLSTYGWWARPPFE